MKITREEAKILAPIIQAFADGKTITYLDNDNCLPVLTAHDGQSIEIDSNHHYEILEGSEDELDVAKFVMYTYADRDELKGKWVIDSTDEQTLQLILTIDKIGINTYLEHYTWKQAFDSLIFENGGPFAKLL